MKLTKAQERLLNEVIDNGQVHVSTTYKPALKLIELNLVGVKRSIYAGMYLVRKV